MNAIRIIAVCCLLSMGVVRCVTCSIGAEYRILEGSVPADYIAYARADTGAASTNIDFANSCTSPLWYLANRFTFSQFTCDVDSKMQENAFTIDRKNMFSTSTDSANLNAYIHAVYNTFEGCAISLQFMPDLAGNTLLMKYNMHTIKSHMDEQNFQVTEFFSNYSLSKTVTGNTMAIQQDTNAVPCSSGKLFYINALKKFVYLMKDRNNKYYWVKLDFPLDGSLSTVSACNINFLPSAAITTTKYQITVPGTSYRSSCTTKDDSVSLVMEDSATVYGIFIYYFVKIRYKTDSGCTSVDSFAYALHTMNLNTGTNSEVVSGQFAVGVTPRYLGHIADYGLAVALSSAPGYKIVPTSTTTGLATSAFIDKGSAVYYKFLQARLGSDGSRPLFAVSSTQKSVIKRITTDIEDVFTAAGHNFFDYQTDIGSLHLMVVYPGDDCTNTNPQTADSTHKKVVIFKMATGLVFKCKIDIASCDSNIDKGNAVTVSPEECDDGNLISGDGVNFLNSVILGY